MSITEIEKFMKSDFMKKHDLTTRISALSEILGDMKDFHEDVPNYVIDAEVWLEVAIEKLRIARDRIK